MTFSTGSSIGVEVSDGCMELSLGREIGRVRVHQFTILLLSDFKRTDVVGLRKNNGMRIHFLMDQTTIPIGKVVFGRLLVEGPSVPIPTCRIGIDQVGST